MIIIANWKMNPLNQQRIELFSENFYNGIKSAQNIEIVICPPFIFLSALFGLMGAKMNLNNIFLGGQNCFWEQEGAYTGEVSPTMLKNLGCSYVIIGHSERRQYLKEDDEIVNKKIIASLRARLRPILCVGERTNEEMAITLEKQVRTGLQNVTATQIGNLIIAYEPVWAIGTGDACSSAQAVEAALFIKRILTQMYDRKIAEKIKIIYGGSVDDKNALEYARDGIDGFLVGGASLNVSKFIKIVNNISQVLK